jgi:hypothetical protein
MAILGRTPKDCFDQFRAHIGSLVGKVLPVQQPVVCKQTDEHGRLNFSSKTVAIDTGYGLVHFYLGQDLGTEKKGSKFRLLTQAYSYRIQLDPGLAGVEALIRWEYERTLRASECHHCRNHFHVGKQDGQAIGLRFPNAVLDLSRAHLPTGWVTIEEVIRFLIHDLGVRPPCGDKWPTVLAESERKFREWTGV